MSHSLIKSFRILVVDDEKDIRDILKSFLDDEGFTTEVARNSIETMAALKTFKPDLLLLDVLIAGSQDGLQILAEVKRLSPLTDIIMMSGHGTIETAVKATRLGAWDFIEKPLSMERVLLSIHHVQKLQNERHAKSAFLTAITRDLEVVGQSEAVGDIKKSLATLAVGKSPLLIEGEAGVGKRLIGMNLHFFSERAAQPLVDFNTKIVQSELIEFSLFDQAALSLWTRAQGGTLLISDICDLSPNAQKRLALLMLTQDPANPRLIAATSNLDWRTLLIPELANLFASTTMLIPALRERIQDLPLLIEHLNQMVSRELGTREKQFSLAALESLKNYNWPGNVRELKNFIERIHIMISPDEVGLADIEFAGLSRIGGSQKLTMNDFREARAEFEREYLVRKIQEFDGNISRTAEVIGLERSYLHRKIKSYGIEVGKHNN